MGTPAFKIESEVLMENRVARLESDAEHIKADIAEIKTDIREMRKDIGAVRGEVHQGFTQVRAELHSAKLWAIVFYVAQTATLLGVMAKGLGWL